MTSELKLPGGALKIRRDGKQLGIFSGDEIALIIAREDGGLLLTDEVFDPTQQKWMRLSEAILESRKPKPPGPPMTWRESIVVFVLSMIAILILIIGGMWMWNFFD